MSRPLLVSTVLLTLLFAACIGLICAQPHNDSELRTLLAPPDGCPMPCFMGIRPGVTTVNEARLMLQAHEWVADVETWSNTIGTFLIQWDWNGQQPDAMDATVRPFINVVDERLVSITIGTRLSLGDILLQLAPPDWSSVTEISGRPPSLYHWLAYQESGFGVLTSTSCSADMNEFLHTPVNIRFLDLLELDQFGGSHYRYSDWVRYPPCAS